MPKGFSLIEILVSISITLVIGVAVFHLFQQNERVFHDQNLVSELQQGVRAAVSQAADEIRMAGQGVPSYAETYDEGPSEGAVAILAGSNSTRINFRAGLAPTEAAAIAPSPVTFTVGTPVTLTVDNVTGLYNAVGGSPTGRFVYVWGTLGTSGWGWGRASIDSIVPSTKSVRVTPAEAGPDGVLRFPAFPTISLEEAIAIYRDDITGAVRRTTATNLNDPVNPSWAPANELVTNVTLLHFDYLDTSGNPVTPDTLANRARIARVDIRLSAQTNQDLSNHTRPAYALSVRTVIRN